MRNKYKIQKMILIVILLLISQNSFSQENINWKTYESSNVKFDFPKQPQIFDTLNTKMYSCQIDTTLTLQLHIFSGAEFNKNEIVFNTALEQENNDTLRAIAKIILLATNSTLVELQEIKTNDILGLKIGIGYTTLSTNIPFLSFFQYYFKNDNMYIFSMTCNKETIIQAQEYAEPYFNSINFKL